MTAEIPKNGSFTDFYMSDTSQMKSKGEYKDGKKDGNWTAQTVKISDINIPFDSMVIFMVKWVIASIPAIIILMILFAIFGGFFALLFSIFN